MKILKTREFCILKIWKQHEARTRRLHTYLRSDAAIPANIYFIFMSSVVGAVRQILEGCQLLVMNYSFSTKKKHIRHNQVICRNIFPLVPKTLYGTWPFCGAHIFV